MKDIDLDILYYAYDGKPTRKTNRHNKNKAKSGAFWCPCCDRQKVGINEKCTVCGHVHAPGKTKPQDEPVYNDVK